MTPPRPDVEIEEIMVGLLIMGFFILLAGLIAMLCGGGPFPK
jgi:hypothetical protein